MGHRHLFNSSQMFGSNHDQNWNRVHSDPPFVNMARSTDSDTGPPFCPVDNMPFDRMHFSPHWNTGARSNAYYPSPNHSMKVQGQPDGSGSSLDLRMHPSALGILPMAPESYAHHASSSNYDRHSYYGVKGSFVDLTIGDGRGPHKRKTTGLSSVSESSDASRYFSPGSSSRAPVSSDLIQEKLNLDYQLMPWDHSTLTPSCRGNGLSIRGEESMRNVRSRSSLDLGSNLRTHLSSNPSYSSYSSSCTVDHSNMLNLPGQSSSASPHEWNHVNTAASSQGRFLPSDARGFVHETNKLHMGDGVGVGVGAGAGAGAGASASASASSTPPDVGPHQDFVPSKSPIVPQSSHAGAHKYVRGASSVYSQRTNPILRPSSSSLHMRNHVPSNDGSQLVSESHCSRYPASVSTAEWHANDRRSRLLNERYRSLSSHGALHDRFSSQGFMIMDHSPFDGSRNMIDQHTEMRLDVDNMSYEELLALGERIGSVSTGLSEDLISKCLIEIIYCSDQTHEEGTCVICLEGYKDMDGVGSLKSCGHDYHVKCIKKWLSMKNLCPICKAAASSDKTTGK